MLATKKSKRRKVGLNKQKSPYQRIVLSRKLQLCNVKRNTFSSFVHSVNFDVFVQTVPAPLEEHYVGLVLQITLLCVNNCIFIDTTLSVSTLNFSVSLILIIKHIFYITTYSILYQHMEFFLMINLECPMWLKCVVWTI